MNDNININSTITGPMNAPVVNGLLAIGRYNLLIKTITLRTKKNHN